MQKVISLLLANVPTSRRDKGRVLFGERAKYLLFTDNQKRLPNWQSFLIGYRLSDIGMLGLILVLLGCLVLLDEFLLYITRNEFVALELHGEGSTTTRET